MANEVTPVPNYQDLMTKWQEMQNVWTETWGHLQGYVDKSNGIAEAFGMKMLILDKGFVYLGKLTISADYKWVYIEDCWSVRYWGTTRGLGQLRKGPTSKTVVDPVGRIQLPYSTLLQIIDVDATKWEAHFDKTLEDIEKEPEKAE